MFTYYAISKYFLKNDTIGELSKESVWRGQFGIVRRNQSGVPSQWRERTEVRGNQNVLG